MIRTKGQIPGLAGTGAFSLQAAEPSPIPILLSVPHAGRAYPPSMLNRMRNPGLACVRLEDRHADSVAAAAAKATGAALLVAHAPRAMIDLNRGPDDMDWTMLGEPHPRAAADRDGPAVGRRARSGLGLIPRRLPGLGDLWKESLSREELDARIEGIHRPYHETLSAELLRLRERWGAAMLLDIHSMPPLARLGSQPPPMIVVGDRFGVSCDGPLIATAFDYLADRGMRTAYNRPYAGGYVLDRHGLPHQGIHALQIEICRSLYLDSRLEEPAEALAEAAEIIAGLIRALAEDVATLGQGGLPLAAE